MRLKKSGVVGAVLFVCMGVAEAGFFDSLAATLAENKAVEQAPDCTLSADEAYARSVELLSDGRQAEAEDLIKFAVKSHRNDIRILFAKAVLERSRWDMRSAEVWFSMAGKAQGNAALSRAAGLSIKLDQHEAVEENMAELICLSNENPGEIYLLWLSAIQYREQGRGSMPRERTQKRAERERVRYEKLLKHFRIGPVLLHQRYANILDDLHEYETSLEHRILAVSMEAAGWSLDGLAFTLYKLEKYEWSSAVYARVLRRTTYNDNYWRRWGTTLYAMNRYDEAEEKYREALRLEPRKGLTWDGLGDCLQKLGKQEEMFKAYQRAVELKYDRALGNLGYCYQLGWGVEKDEKKAFELYWLCAEKTDSVYSCVKLGDCYFHGVGVEKDFYKAREYYEGVALIRPDYVKGLSALSWDLATSKEKALLDYPRAVKLAERAVALGKDRYNLDTLAVAYLKNKQYDKAVQTAERIIAYWQLQHPGKPVPKGQLKRLERYKKLRKEAGESF